VSGVVGVAKKEEKRKNLVKSTQKDEVIESGDEGEDGS
jgi:hypothetical protein